MTELVMATRNNGKIAEMKDMLPFLSLLSLPDIGFEKDIPEPYETFEENAYTKAYTVYQFCGKNVFADDSGLCVPALHGAPGVHSAYYGGEPRSDEKNNVKLLGDLKGLPDRSAHYKALLCLIWNGKPHYFEGICKGTISEQMRGDKGFGYDPLFIPDGYQETFGELPPAVKHGLSHRGQAIAKMRAFLETV